MKTLSFLFFIALAVTHCFAVKPAYKGLVITSIDVRRPDPNNKKRVEFSGRIRGNENDETAIVLKNVVEVRREGNVPIFQADEVNVAELKKSVKKPLLCIHGFNVQPEAHLEQCRLNKDKFEKFYVLPVIWPSTGGIQNYLGDRGYSKGAGEALKKALAKYAGLFPRKSIMCHSMGNRVLRYAADGKFGFDNIFMVAADVNNEMFDKAYIDNNSEDRRKDGLRIKNMLNKSVSKIHVLHNRQDFALVGSTAVKFGVGRLGAGGARKSKLHPDVKDEIENINCGRKWLNWTPRFASHSYQWDDEAIAYYESKFV